ncbi:MAG: Methyltransferase type 11 [Rhodospirillales bacterium]|nr:Methyltransferase type 11 [Rhodospirillales bacterium]
MESNRERYESASVLAAYQRLDGLFPAERAILESIADRLPGAALLDLGCGAGRTTERLIDCVQSYVAVDYAGAMIEHCRRRFGDRTNARFVNGDAGDLWWAEDRSFDFVLFSFNGIDCVQHTHRLRVLAEIRRVLKPDGLFLFSSHNRDHHSIVRRPTLQPTLQPRSLKRQFEHLYNSLVYRRREQVDPTYEIINDDGAGFSMLTYYIAVGDQLAQLHGAGFETLSLVDHEGRRRPAAADDFSASSSVHFVARVAPIRTAPRVAPVVAPRVHWFGSERDLPAACATILAEAGHDDVFARRAWFATMEGAGLPAGSLPTYAVLAEGLRPIALLPCRSEHHEGGRLALHGLTNCYTGRYRPLVARDIDSWRAGIELGRCIGEDSALDLVALDCLAPDDPASEGLLAGLREAGRFVLSHDEYGYWQGGFPAGGYDEYWKARPGWLREIVRRKTRRLAERGPVAIEIATEPDRLARAVQLYNELYARSWKPPEPFPAFQTTLVDRMGSGAGLSIGLLSVADQPVAAQIWTATDGVAVVHKLTHDPAYDRWSPGTILTARMIAFLDGREPLRCLELGRGDDPYKRSWVTGRRQHYGITAPRRASLTGTATAFRHALSPNHWPRAAGGPKGRPEAGRVDRVDARQP